MDEYIKRSYIRKMAMFEMAYTMETETDAAVVLRMIDDAPAADVAPVVHGRWKYYHKQNKAVCTRCSFERDLDENFGAAISCPNCGAKMDGAE
nr:MAG TPA: hydrogenase/urease nickel incorporation protein [Caudoviricetes sp.]